MGAILLMAANDICDKKFQQYAIIELSDKIAGSKLFLKGKVKFKCTLKSQVKKIPKEQ